MPQSPETIGPYTLEKLLGSGGMGEVYQAYDHRLHRRVAIKQLQNGAGSDDATRERFLHEARAVASLSHPSIVQIHDILEDESGDWIVMERVDGPTVAQLVAQGPLPIPRAVSIGRQVAEGLVEAHDQGILHRDLKSENVMLARGDRVKILDFGLAKKLRPKDGEASLAGQGRVLGTCRAMSPEQARDQELDERSDLFSLGVLLYEMLTGESPFQADNHTDTLTRVCHFQPSPVTDKYPEVPADLSALVDRLLQKDREKRPQTAKEVAEFFAALDAQLSPTSGSMSGPVLDGVPPPPVVAGPAWMTESVYWAPESRKLPRRWWWIGVATIVVLLVTAFWLWEWGKLKWIQVRPSVAVLSLGNVTGSEEIDWLGTAISKAVNAELAAGRELRVIPSERVASAIRDLEIPIGETLSLETLSKLQDFLGTDWVIVGWYTSSSEGFINLNLFLQDTETGESPRSLSDSTRSETVVDLGHRMGRQFRQFLGAGTLSANDIRTAKATLPTDEAARRSYSEGLRSLENREFVTARRHLEEAVTLEPDFPLSYAALAEAHAALGFDTKAREAAQSAADRVDQLSPQDKQFVRARNHEMAWRREAAIEAYRTLWENYPDNIEYGLSLAAAYLVASQGEQALEVLAHLRKLPLSGDVRLDLVEIEALRSLSRYEALLSLADQAEKRGEGLGARIFTAKVCLHRAFALLRKGRPEEAEAAARKARLLYEEAGDPLGQALATNRIGNVFYESGDCTKALPYFEEFRTRMRAMGHKKGLASALNNVASCSTIQGDLAKTESLLQESIDLTDEVGDLTQAALARVNLAELQVRYGRLNEAQKTLDDLSEQAERREFPYAENFAHFVQGLVYLWRGEVNPARTMFEQAHRGYSATGDSRYMSFTLHSLGLLERMAGNPVAAQNYYRQALDQRQVLKDDYLAAQSEVGLGWSVLDLDPRKSLDLARSSRSAFQRLDSLDSEIEAIGLEVAAQMALGYLDDLDTILRDGEELSSRSENLLTHLENGIHLARGWHALGQTPRARKSLDEIRHQAKDHGLVPLELEAMLALADLEQAGGRVVQAQDLRREVSRRADAQRLGLLQRKANSGLGPS